MCIYIWYIYTYITIETKNTSRKNHCFNLASTNSFKQTRAPVHWSLPRQRDPPGSTLGAPRCVGFCATATLFPCVHMGVSINGGTIHVRLSPFIEPPICFPFRTFETWRTNLAQALTERPDFQLLIILSKTNMAKHHTLDRFEVRWESASCFQEETLARSVLCIMFCIWTLMLTCLTYGHHLAIFRPRSKDKQTGLKRQVSTVACNIPAAHKS